jgi:hypothetical protein
VVAGNCFCQGGTQLFRGSSVPNLGTIFLVPRRMASGPSWKWTFCPVFGLYAFDFAAL